MSPSIPPQESLREKASLVHPEGTPLDKDSPWDGKETLLEQSILHSLFRRQPELFWGGHYFKILKKSKGFKEISGLLWKSRYPLNSLRFCYLMVAETKI